MFISVDFDGTCVTHEYPRIGKDIGAEIVLRKLVSGGHNIICTTMRSSKDKIDTVGQAMEWFEKRGIPLYGFNDNPSQREWSSSRKIFAHIYIDDQFLGVPLAEDSRISNRPFVNWVECAELLYLNGFITIREYREIIKEFKEKYEQLYEILWGSKG